MGVRSSGFRFRMSKSASLNSKRCSPGIGLLCLMLLLLAGCTSGPDPVYQGPEGAGRLIYDPEVGITRRGADAVRDEQTLYAAAEAAFRERRWDDCIAGARALTENFPEGSRAVDAILLRIRANLEAGRADDGLPVSLLIDQWMFVYLAPDHDERLQFMLARDEQSRTFVREIRALSVQEFLDRIQADAIRLHNTRRLDAAQRDVNTLTTYYLPVLHMREYRRRVSELGRDVAWLMFAARNYSRAIQICDELLAVNPPPNVKGDTLFVLGHAQRLNGAYALAASTFGYLYRGAGLRDTDTRWRPFALMSQIDQTIATSKGYIYDLTPYEIALELLGEYELYRFENPNIPDSVKAGCRTLLEEVYDVMARRELNAARTYTRVGQRGAADYHRGRAAEWNNQLAQRLTAWQEDP
jgi:hypothetical protein